MTMTLGDLTAAADRGDADAILREVYSVLHQPDRNDEAVEAEWDSSTIEIVADLVNTYVALAPVAGDRGVRTIELSDAELEEVSVALYERRDYLTESVINSSGADYMAEDRENARAKVATIDSLIASLGE